MRYLIVILLIFSFLSANSCEKNDLIEIGKEMLRNGRFMEAKAHFKNIIRFQPQNAKAHYQLGRVYYALDQYQEAVEQYKSTSPDAVLLDITMPDMGGLSALKEIRAHDSDARVAMVTAMGQQSIVMEALQAGAKDFVVKPFDAERVLAAVGKLVA